MKSLTSKRGGENIGSGTHSFVVKLKSVAQTLAAILAAVLARGAEDPSLLAIRLTEGDGAIYAKGSRATRGLTVLITDETGRPVEGATVSFSLPAKAPAACSVPVPGPKSRRLTPMDARRCGECNGIEYPDLLKSASRLSRGKRVPAP